MRISPKLYSVLPTSFVTEYQVTYALVRLAREVQKRPCIFILLRRNSDAPLFQIRRLHGWVRRQCSRPEEVQMSLGRCQHRSRHIPRRRHGGPSTRRVRDRRPQILWYIMLMSYYVLLVLTDRDHKCTLGQLKIGQARLWPFFIF